MKATADERPILFSGAMVRAILGGTKTQTRRAAKPRKNPSLLDGSWSDDYVLDPGNREWLMRDCPYGQPGDRLWVREAFRFLDVFDSDSPATVGNRCLNAGYRSAWAPTHYEADSTRRYWQHVGTPPHDSAKPTPGKLRPGIHMPRWTSRILLEITGVRVERLQAITPNDCIAEGAWKIEDRELGRGSEAVEAYRSLWEQLNGEGSWDTNPWVWVIEFRRVEPQQ